MNLKFEDAHRRASLRRLLPTGLALLLLFLLRSLVGLHAAETRQGRVLVLGDSISVGYTAQVRERLKDVADVIRPTETNGHVENCEGTTKGVKELSRWLAFDGGNWDVIHFNFGLHDLKRVNPRTRLNSTRMSHPRQAEPDIYERQFREILQMLKGTRAKLIFATTTPVPAGPVDPLRDPNDVERYNNIARRLAETEGIVVNDLYTLAKSRQNGWQRPLNVHFTDKGNEALAYQVAAFIRRALTDALGSQLRTSAPPANLVPTFLLSLPDPKLDVALWATTPLLRRPTHFDFDPAGRLWVADGGNARGHSDQEPDHARIVVLEDTDQDGLADRSSVFVQEASLRGLKGLTILDNRVVVSVASNLVVYTDVNRDRRFDPNIDRREVWLTGPTLHSVTVGPDGQWYWNADNRGAQFTDRSGKTFRIVSTFQPASGRRDVQDFSWNPILPGQRSDDGRVWLGGFVARMNSDGSDVRIVGHNFRDSAEQTVTSFGDVFLNDNDQPPTGRTDFLLEYGNAGFCSLDGQRSWEKDRRPGQSAALAARRQEDPGVMPAGDVYEGGVPAGMAFVEESALGPKYRGLLLSCDPGRNTIFGYFPKPRGAGYQLDRFEFLTSNPEIQLADDVLDAKHRGGVISIDLEKHFRPSAVAVGPDGAIYVANSFDSGDSVSGAIYRIATKDFKPRVPAVHWNTLSGTLEALRNPAVHVRAAARAAFLNHHPKSNALIPLLKDENPYVRARAVWCLGQLGEEADEQLQRLLKSGDAPTRVATFRTLRRRLENGNALTSPRFNALISKMAVDSSPAVRREVALALRDVSWAQGKDALLAVAKGFDGKDRWYLEALGTGASGKERELYDALLPALGHAEPLRWNARFSALAWRLHPPQSASAFQQRALSSALPEKERRAALTALAFIGTREAVQALLEIAARADGPVKADALWWLLNRKDNLWKEYALDAELKRRQLD